jgi:dimethylpropiothetin dethiomethylase
MEKLSTHVNWHYMLREYWTLYRFGSAGGSKAIRSHQRDARNTLSAELDTNPVMEFEQPQALPVCDWLGRAIDQGLLERTAPMIRAFSRVANDLSWKYGYERLNKDLARKYAYTELMGPHGVVMSDRLILGMVLLAPRCTYPEHSHDGITESYVCLSGTVSDSPEKVSAPGSLLLNPPQKPHRMTTGDFEPTLLAYAWLGPPEKLTHQKMDFSRTRR